MTYSKTKWVDGSSPYINATNLNNLEDGVSEALQNSEAASEKVDAWMDSDGNLTGTGNITTTGAVSSASVTASGAGSFNTLTAGDWKVTSAGSLYRDYDDGTYSYRVQFRGAYSGGSNGEAVAVRRKASASSSWTDTLFSLTADGAVSTKSDITVTGDATVGGDITATGDITGAGCTLNSLTAGGWVFSTASNGGYMQRDKTIDSVDYRTYIRGASSAATDYALAVQQKASSASSYSQNAYIRANGYGYFSTVNTPTLNINGTKVADFVTTNSTSGSWRYRKWNSGTIEAWYQPTSSVDVEMGSSSTGGGIYQGTTDISIPSGLFSSVPTFCIADTALSGTSSTILGVKAYVAGVTKITLVVQRLTSSAGSIIPRLYVCYIA